MDVHMHFVCAQRAGLQITKDKISMSVLVPANLTSERHVSSASVS